MKTTFFCSNYGNVVFGDFTIFVGENDQYKRYLLDQSNILSDGPFEIFPNFGVSHPKQQMDRIKLDLTFSLIYKTYRKIYFTNTTPILDFTWAFQCMKKRLVLQGAKHPELKEEFTSKMEAAFCKLFDLKNQKSLRGLMDLDIVVYMMLPNGKLKDISNLDPGSDDVDESEFGGLTTVSEKMGDLVSDFADWNDTDKVPNLSRKLTTKRHVF